MSKQAVEKERDAVRKETAYWRARFLNLVISWEADERREAKEAAAKVDQARKEAADVRDNAAQEVRVALEEVAAARAQAEAESKKATVLQSKLTQQTNAA